MSLLSNNCKINPNCNIVIPVDDRANIGSSLSAIALNFTNLDTTLCNISTSALEYWNPSSLEFQELKPQWEDMLNVIQTYSSCWNTTFDTVNTLSAFWLKPITMVYPFPFESTATGVAELVKSWLNENFPPRVGSCFNFIVGQELYVFTPEYTNINRFINATQVVALQPKVTVAQRGAAKMRPPTNAESKKPGVGPFIRQFTANDAPREDLVNTTRVTLVGEYKCIMRTTPIMVKIDFKIDSTVGVLAPDKFIEHVVGLKFKINPDTYTWEFEENLFNIA